MLALPRHFWRQITLFLQVQLGVIRFGLLVVAVTSSRSGVCWPTDTPFIIAMECSLTFHRLTLIHVMEVYYLELGLEALMKALPGTHLCQQRFFFEGTGGA